MFSNLTNVIREICKGSGKISLLSIAATTLIVYLAFTIISNPNFFLLITHIKGIEDFESKEKYLLFIETITLHETRILIPAICALILLITPTKHLKSNINNRLLPISTHTRIVAFVLTIICITVVSLCIVHVIDAGMIYYFRTTFLSEAVALQENFGDLYKKLPNLCLLSSNFQLDETFTTRMSIMIIIFSLAISIVYLNLYLLFTRQSLVKGALLVISVAYSAFLLNRVVTDSHSNNITIHVPQFPYVLHLYLILLTFSLLFSLFYLLKEREE